MVLNNGTEYIKPQINNKKKRPPLIRAALNKLQLITHRQKWSRKFAPSLRLKLIRTRLELRDNLVELLTALITHMDQCSLQVQLVPGINITHEQLRKRTNLSERQYYRTLHWLKIHGYVCTKRNNKEIDGNGRYCGFAGFKEIKRKFFQHIRLDKVLKKNADHVEQCRREQASVNTLNRQLAEQPENPDRQTPIFGDFKSLLSSLYKKPT